jgi:Rod binding domain-containing protein
MQIAPPNLTLSNPTPGNPEDNDKLRTAFQDFTAGTVFKQMLKSLRKLHAEPAYFHGGQAEETFRNLLDERVAEDLATSHGRAISEPLFQAFQHRVPPASGGR